MTKPFVVAHISDFHVSTFGDTFHDRGGMIRRSARVANVTASTHDVCWEEAGWRVVREKRARRGKVTLVDPEGYSHAVPSVRAAGGLLDPVERAAGRAFRVEARRATTLAAGLPSEGGLAVLLEATPRNSNLRFLRAARAVPSDGPDAVDAIVATGDITDDGEGYEIVEAALAPWVAKRRLFAIPGNHDIYLFPLAGSARPRPTHASKRAAFAAFAARLGLTIDPSGAFARSIPEASAIVVGLDSCARKQRAFYRHNGAIGPAQLAWLRELATTKDWKDARHRLVAVHHHVVPLPHAIGKRAPMELGMRLDDAREFAETLNAVGATLVMHGHRHISEARQPAGCNFELLAAPSFTLGCKSGDVPSYWRIELGDRAASVERVRVPVEAIEQENDPGAEQPSEAGDD